VGLPALRAVKFGLAANAQSKKVVANAALFTTNREIKRFNVLFAIFGCGAPFKSEFGQNK